MKSPRDVSTSPARTHRAILSNGAEPDPFLDPEFREQLRADGIDPDRELARRAAFREFEESGMLTLPLAGLRGRAPFKATELLEFVAAVVIDNVKELRGFVENYLELGYRADAASLAEVLVIAEAVNDLVSGP